MPDVRTEDAVLHVEVDGDGEPVTVLAHGLTNNCKELAAFTPFVTGTKVRFDFRGHGRSSAPAAGYRFEDFARDLDGVAREFGATRAVGTSLGAGALANLASRRPERFEKMVWLLPAGLDEPFAFRDRYMRMAEQVDGKSPEEAFEAIVSDPERAAEYLQAPWRLELDKVMWEHRDPDGLARAIRGVTADFPVPDRKMLRTVSVPVLLVCIGGDPIHPVELGRLLAELLPNAELIEFQDQNAIFAGIPELVRLVSTFLG